MAIELWEMKQRQSGNIIGADIAKILRKEFGDVRLPSKIEWLESSLEESAKEYDRLPANPEVLTRFMNLFWLNAGLKIEKIFTVDKFPSTSLEMMEKRKDGYMPIYVPEGVNYRDLKEMFPEMQIDFKRYSILDKTINFGWLWIESQVSTPYPQTTEGDLRILWERKKKQGQSLRTYIVGRQISKLIVGRYFDETTSRSRLLGSYIEDSVIEAISYPSGVLYLNSDWNPETCEKDMGGRSEEKIKV